MLYISSSHERSHIMCSYGMSPFPQGDPCYALLWEGTFGAFYEINHELNITKHADILSHPGHRYSILYALAGKGYAGKDLGDAAGKLMALTSYSARTPSSLVESELIDKHSLMLMELFGNTRAVRFSPYYKCGVESEMFKQISGKFSDALFDRFDRFAKQHLRKGYPLIMGGGCGLNCEWNSRWKSSGLFSDVFVPPCVNDTGFAIGSAVGCSVHAN